MNTIWPPTHSCWFTLEGQCPDALEAGEFPVRMQLAVLGQTSDQVFSRTPRCLIYCIYHSFIAGEQEQDAQAVVELLGSSAKQKEQKAWRGMAQSTLLWFLVT